MVTNNLLFNSLPYMGAKWIKNLVRSLDETNLSCNVHAMFIEVVYHTLRCPDYRNPLSG